MLLFWAVLLELGTEIQSFMHNTCESLPKVAMMFSIQKWNLALMLD